MKLVNLYLEDFRHIKDTTIEFGEKLTVISGQNGTGKSSVLGWVAQLCKFNGDERQINGIILQRIGVRFLNSVS